MGDQRAGAGLGDGQLLVGHRVPEHQPDPSGHQPAVAVQRPVVGMTHAVEVHRYALEEPDHRRQWDVVLHAGAPAEMHHRGQTVESGDAVRPEPVQQVGVVGIAEERLGIGQERLRI
mgnify:CR=1 FL=1